MTMVFSDCNHHLRREGRKYDIVECLGRCVVNGGWETVVSVSSVWDENLIPDHYLRVYRERP
jgi:hypothetical protein